MEPVNNEEKLEEKTVESVMNSEGVSEEAKELLDEGAKSIADIAKKAILDAGGVIVSEDAVTVSVSEEKVSDETNVDDSEENTKETDEEVSKEAQVEADETDEEESEAESDENDEEDDEEESEEDAKKKKVKIIIISVFGFILLCAAIYVAAIMGGKNNNIPVEIKEETTVEEAVEKKQTEAKTETKATPTPEVEDEEPAEESMITLLPGNRNYDSCEYADGGVVIVKKGDKFGAINYEGKEIAKCNYDSCYEYPTDEGYFVLSNSKVESKTEEKDGSTFSYETEVTTYTLFDNTGKEVYKGNNAVKQSGNMYILGIEEDDNTKSRIEYYILNGKSKPVYTVYTTEPKNINGFKDGNITVMGYNMPTSVEDEKGVRNIICGSMNENGKVTTFAIAPGVKEFGDEYTAWEAANKTVVDKKDTKKKKNKKETVEESEENTDTEEALEGEETTDESETDENVEETDDSDTEDENTEEAEEEALEDEVDDSVTGGPKYEIYSILNSIHDGYFVYRNIYNSDSKISFYTIRGEWFADIDPTKIKSDAKKGFVIGERDAEVSIASYLSDGEFIYNYGPMMVLKVGKQQVLVDVSKAKGMTSDTMKDSIILGVYEEVRLSDSEHWVVKKNGKYTYIDHNAKEMKVVYDDASDFYNGYAVVVKDGKAKIINENFEELEDIGEAQNAYISGDLMHTVVNGKVMNYILKDVKENPLGVEDKDGKN